MNVLYDDWNKKKLFNGKKCRKEKFIAVWLSSNVIDFI